MPRLALVSLAVVMFAGCAMTRVVKSRPGRGGVIMIKEGLIGDARKDADKLMKANCGRKRVRVTEEGEAVVGSRSSATTDDFTGGSATTSQSTDKTEWRIKYRCVGGGRRKRK